jgi:predicted metal-dependent phosphoesterase TrpH
MKRYADLHVHTNHSDGLYTPEQVVKIAIEKGIKVLAIADHDTTTAYDEALKYVAEEELTLIPAVELSTAQNGTELHILGYLMDHKNPAFARKTKEFRQERLVRGEKIVEKLNELGIELSMDTVRRVAGKSTLGRPHIADALVEQEYVRTFNEAFARYLGYHAPAYVPKFHITPEQGIQIIHEAGGVAVLAHPGTLARDDLIPGLASVGLDGIEAIYPLHSHHVVKKYMTMAADLGLIFTGGSDCHGRPDSRMAIGSVTVPKQCYDDLLAVKEKRSS